MGSRIRPIGLLAAGVLVLSGCGGGEDEPDTAAPPASAPSPAAPDPKAEWISAVTGACTTLSGATSGKMLQLGGDGKYTPKEVLAMEEAARPAVDAFDAELAALPAPPEAAEADKALKNLMTKYEPMVQQLLAAAKSGDQAAVNKVLAEREKLRLSPEGIPALTAAGLPERCNVRGAFS